MKLPWILSKTDIDEQTILAFKNIVNSLMNFMKKNIITFFIDEYEPASEEYILSFN